jgi:hypothetical protein
MRSSNRNPCKGYEDANYKPTHINESKGFGRCSFRGCNARVKIQRNEHGELIAAYHFNKGEPQWDPLMDRRASARP